VAHVSPAPPAPIVARTPCGTFVLEPDGSVRRHGGGGAPAWAPHAVSHPGPGVWVAHPHGRLAVYRSGALLWRSRIKVASDEVVVHGSSIAFGRYARYENESDGPTLWMARVGGREFRVGNREDPIGWTAGGLVTQHAERIRVRGPDGSLYRTLALGRSAAYDVGDATVVFVRRDGSVVRTDGKRLWSLRRAVSRNAWIVVLANRMLQVTERRRTLYLRSNGSLLGIGGDPTGGVTGLPGQRGVAYVTNPPRQKRGASVAGKNIVRLIDASGRARQVYVRAAPRPSCGEWASVSYGNGWLLYTDSEGPAAVIDPNGRRPPLDLTPALRALQPRPLSRSTLYADWLTNWR
jgi:hypothetical protein